MRLNAQPWVADDLENPVPTLPRSIRAVNPAPAGENLPHGARESSLMIEAPETPHRQHAVHRLFDMAMAIAIVLVSLGSLYVSLHTGSTMERLVEQNSRLVRANSMPLLQFGTGNVTPDGSPEINLQVSNVGTGPARIVWFEIRQEDGRLVRHYRDLLPKGKKLSRRDAAIFTSPIAPSMMSAGGERTLLSWPRPAAGSPTLPSWERLNKSRFRLRVEACYCSLFDECWLTRAAADVPRRIATCEVGNRANFRG